MGQSAGRNLHAHAETRQIATRAPHRQRLRNNLRR